MKEQNALIVILLTATLAACSSSGSGDTSSGNASGPETTDPITIIEEDTVPAYQDPDVGLPPFPSN